MIFKILFSPISLNLRILPPTPPNTLQVHPNTLQVHPRHNMHSPRSLSDLFLAMWHQQETNLRCASFCDGNRRSFKKWTYVKQNRVITLSWKPCQHKSVYMLKCNSNDPFFRLPGKGHFTLMACWLFFLHIHKDNKGDKVKSCRLDEKPPKHTFVALKKITFT